MSEQIRAIGKINNYYGRLFVKREVDKFFWAMEDYKDEVWEEIPKYLFDALNKHQDELDTLRRL